MTEDELLELEELRREKRQSLQQARAKDALELRGVPTSFAPILVGNDDQETDLKIDQFCTAYQDALSEDVRKRLPQQPPLTTSAPPSHKKYRGIHRVR